MKKWIALLMFFLFTGTLLTACKQPTYSSKEEEICALYLDLLGKEAKGLTVDSFTVRYVYEFQNASAVFIDGGAFDYTQTLRTETVNGLNFEFSNSQILYIYCNKQLYSIKKAFTKGILTENELTEFHQAHKELYPYLYETD